MLDRRKRGTGCSWSDGWIRTLVPDRVGAIASLLILRREVDDEPRVLESATCIRGSAYLHRISASLLQRRKDIRSLLYRGHGLKRDSGIPDDFFEGVVEGYDINRDFALRISSTRQGFKHATHKKQNLLLQLWTELDIPIFRRQKRPSSYPLFALAQYSSGTRLDYHQLYSGVTTH